MKFIHITVALFSISLLTGCGGNDDSKDKTPSPATQNTATAVQGTSEAVDSLARGAKLYKRCQTCHTLEKDGRHKVGPNLWAVAGSTAGTRDDFAYSKVMIESGIVWNMQTLDAYIENPRKYMPGNRMSYAGLRNAEDRAALLAFMLRETQPE